MKLMIMQFTTAGFGAVMATEREQKLRNQNKHSNHALKKDDHTTDDVKHSTNPSKKQPATGKQSSKITKETVPVLKDDHLVTAVPKRLKQKV